MTDNAHPFHSLISISNIQLVENNDYRRRIDMDILYYGKRNVFVLLVQVCTNFKRIVCYKYRTSIYLYNFSIREAILLKLRANYNRVLILQSKRCKFCSIYNGFIAASALFQLTVPITSNYINDLNIIKRHAMQNFINRLNLRHWKISDD
jgi:hypothetical protein